MLCYKDKTFCPYFKSCKHGSNCDRALTDEVLDKIEESGLYYAQFGSEPECYEENEE